MGKLMQMMPARKAREMFLAGRQQKMLSAKNRQKMFRMTRPKRMRMSFLKEHRKTRMARIRQIRKRLPEARKKPPKMKRLPIS